MSTSERSMRNMSRNRIQELVITALFIALVYVCTWQINVRLPFMGTGGLIHLGNVPLFIGAFLFGRRTGALCGAFGMALFDLMSGWAAWSPFTFVIVGLMGYTVGWFSEKQPVKNVHVNNLAAILAAIIIKVTGYYFAEVILYHNWIAPFGSIPGNILQVAIAGVIVFAVIEKLRKHVH